MFEQESINEYIIKFTGGASLPFALEKKDVIIMVKGSVNKIEEEDNQDGTKNIIYKCKLVEVREFKED